MLTPSRLTAAALAVVLGLAACSSSSDTPAAPKQFHPAAAASLLVRQGALTVKGEGTMHPKGAKASSAPVRGRIDPGKPPRVDEALPVTINDRVLGITWRQDGNQAWIRRVSAKGVGRIEMGPSLLLLHGADKPAWGTVDPDTTLAKFFVGAYNPVTLLQYLGSIAAPFTTAPAADVGGHSRAGFHTKLGKKPAATIGAQTVTVWVTPSGRPVRIALTTPAGMAASYDIGTAKSVTVAAPPAKDIEKIAPAPSANGPYTVAASGTAAGVAYQVLRAPATDGGTCWKVESTPPYVPQVDTGTKGYCVPPLGPATGQDDLIGFPLDGVAGTPYDMLGLLVPPGSTMEMYLVGGGTLPVTVDSSGLGLWAGPPSPAAALAAVTLPDQRVLYCAPGLILTPNDVNELAPGDDDQVFSEPWNCVFAADVT